MCERMCARKCKRESVCMWVFVCACVPSGHIEGEGVDVHASKMGVSIFLENLEFFWWLRKLTPKIKLLDTNAHAHADVCTYADMCL